MGTAIFRRGASSRYADAFVERSWMLVSTGEVGTATIELPYSAAAASETYIDPTGGSWVEIVSEGGSGDWIGIITDIQYTQTGITMQASQPQFLLGRRIMHWEALFRHAAPAGWLVKKVLYEALPGIPWLWINDSGFDEASDNLVRNFRFEGQDAWSIIQQMMDESNSELFINGQTGEVTWEGALAGGASRLGLMADGDFHDWAYNISVEGKASEVIAKAGTYRYMTTQSTGGLPFPAQMIITSGASGDPSRAAGLELIRAATSKVTISGGVLEDYWSIRERDIVRIAFPQVGLGGGAEHPCRVLGRSLSDSSALMTLILQVIFEDVGIRIAPPMRSGSANNTGALGRGSISQRFRSGSRLSWLSFLRDN